MKLTTKQLKKIHIKKYKKVKNFQVWIVNGKYIRDNIDEEFVNFGHHCSYNFVPENEFWIDKEYGKGDDKKFYVEHMLIEHSLISNGEKYDKALEKADRIERGERRKHYQKELFKKIHLKLLKKYSGKVKVWIVNGKIVRDLLFIDFTEGGHDKVYGFIPKKEIWLDDDVSESERKFMLLHELHERNLMARGWCYYIGDKRKEIKNNHNKIHRSAHKSASHIEMYCRKHPKKTEEFIMREVSISEKIN